MKPLNRRRHHNGTMEAASVRDKLDSVQSSVNELIENLETEKKKIKDKKLLTFLAVSVLF